MTFHCCDSVYFCFKALIIRFKAFLALPQTICHTVFTIAFFSSAVFFHKVNLEHLKDTDYKAQTRTERALFFRVCENVHSQNSYGLSCNWRNRKKKFKTPFPVIFFLQAHSHIYITCFQAVNHGPIKRIANQPTGLLVRGGKNSPSPPPSLFTYACPATLS